MDARIRFRNGPALTIKDIITFELQEGLFETPNGKVYISMADILYLDIDTAVNSNSNSELVQEGTGTDEETSNDTED